MFPSRQTWITLGMVAALVGIALVGREFSAYLQPPQELTGTADPGCDLHRRSCPGSLPGGGQVELSILPHPIPYLQPLDVEVRVTGAVPRRVEIDFAGESMNMGLNRVELAASAAGRYTGKAALPVCVTGSMTWVATVIIDTGLQRVAIPYRFATGR